MSLTTDPQDPRLKRDDASGGGQNEVYLVLSEEERAKGFVRPLRRKYVHVGQQPKFPLRELTAKEHEDHDRYGYVAFEKYPDNAESAITGRFWTQAQLDNKGCGVVTTMGMALCETYARDPKFYGATFCVGCNAHFAVAQFRWDEDNQVVGS